MFHVKHIGFEKSHIRTGHRKMVDLQARTAIRTR